MVRFTSTIDVAAGVEQVWQRITDWPAHSRWVPFTKVTVTSDRPDGVGATFLAASAIGPIGFDDPMEIVEWTAPTSGRSGRPGHCRVQKHGRLLHGWAELTVASLSDGVSRVSWLEEVQVSPVRLTRPFDPLIAAGAKAGFDRTLRAMARELEAEVHSGG
jgi:hypothetical protein